MVDTIIRILSCGLSVLGYATFHCSNADCSHVKKICFGCKARFCNTCGKKRTDQWIETQKSVLPYTPWQHIIFTMPGELWEIFKINRHLLGDLSRLAANTLLKTAKKRGITPGIFTALHTFGRDLKWNTHIHLSITLGGLFNNDSEWRSLFFKKDIIMPQWRYAVIKLLRDADNNGNLKRPASLENDRQWREFLNKHYEKKWILYFSKSTNNPKHTVSYLGRYISRPPLAMSQLKHYDGQTVIFRYLDHNTKTYRRFTCTGEEFIERLTQHIPEKGFRLIRYYGFLAHRVRSTLLPIVYELIDQPKISVNIIRYPELLKSTFGLDPLICILCQSTMCFSGITVGKPLWELRQYHERLALQKIVH